MLGKFAREGVLERTETVLFLFYSATALKESNFIYPSLNDESYFAEMLDSINDRPSLKSAYTELCEELLSQKIFQIAPNANLTIISTLYFHEWMMNRHSGLMTLRFQSLLEKHRIKWDIDDKIQNFRNHILSPNDFQLMQIQDPLWELNCAFLHMSGYQSYPIYEINSSCIASDEKLNGLYNRALQSIELGELSLYSNKDHASCKMVKPVEIVAWAEKRKLPLALVSSSSAVLGFKHVTFEMQLMFDAIEYFWKEYDLASPKPSVAPYKKNVVTWLQNTAKMRGVTLSDSLASSIDTIIRCPASRKGGNTN